MTWWIGTLTLWGAVLVATFALFVVTQHGLANTLKSIGLMFLRAGKQHERRIADRTAKVNQQMVRELEAA
jgi:hypothetical protein